MKNNLNLPNLEIWPFVFADTDIKLCQNIVRTPEKVKIPQILEYYHCGKNNLHRGINERVRSIKEKYDWLGLVKDVEKL